MLFEYFSSIQNDNNNLYQEKLLKQLYESWNCNIDKLILN